jgi:hypothetical protein
MRRNVIFTVCEKNVSCTFKQQKTGMSISCLKPISTVCTWMKVFLLRTSSSMQGSLYSTTVINCLVTDELVNYIYIYIYKSSVPAWQRTLLLSIKKTSLLMLFMEIINIYCGIIENNCTIRHHCMRGIWSRKLSHKLNTKFPFNTVYFLEVRRLTTSFCIVYDYTTTGHTNL